MTLPTPSDRATGADPRKITNWNWTMGDMDRLAKMVSEKTASEIADAFGTTADEIRAVCARNGLVVYPIKRQA